MSNRRTVSSANVSADDARFSLTWTIDNMDCHPGIRIVRITGRMIKNEASRASSTAEVDMPITLWNMDIGEDIRDILAL